VAEGKPQAPVRRQLCWGKQSSTYRERLTRPTIVGKEIACITPPSGVQSFSTESHDWTNNPPLLDAATSVAVSLNRNLVVQTKDSIQIFSVDVLTSREARNNVRPSHVYPLGKAHPLCPPTKQALALLELETLRELRSDDDTLPFRSLLPNQTPSARASFFPGLVGKLDISAAMQAWQSGTPFPEGLRLPTKIRRGHCMDCHRRAPRWSQSTAHPGGCFV
jgi:hypothetical protein